MVLAGMAATLAMPRVARGAEPVEPAAADVTFVFSSDTHACLMHGGLAPKCQDEGKTDDALRRHIKAVDGIGGYAWPREIDGVATNLVGAGQPIATPRGLVMGGDLTDDGGGQVAIPGEGTQLQQFSQRYRKGDGPDQIHLPVYLGLGNHDLDQDGPPGHRDWYRREMRDYVALNHRQTVFYKPPLPVADYDVYSDNYSWDWGGLHLVQAERYAGDTAKDTVDSLPWLIDDLQQNAADGRPVILFQHYGWDPFSTERWDPERETYDPMGAGPPHWWSPEQRTALLAALAGYNVIGIFHGHEHPTPMIYRAGDIDVFKPTAAYLGGFAVVRLGGNFMDVALAEARGADGQIAFLKAFSKPVRRTSK